MIVNNKKVQNDPTQKKIKFILELFNSNKLIETKKEVDKQLTIYSKSSVLFNILGAVLAEQNKLQEALESYNKSIKINPNYAQAYNNLSACLYKLGKIDEANQSYQKAIKIQPNNPDSHNNLGVVFVEQGEREKSITCFQKAIEIQPNHADAHYNLGTVFKKLEETQKAISCFQKAIEIQSNHVNAHNNLGMVFDELGEFQKALSCYEKAIEIQPSHSKAHYNLGMVFIKLGERKKAISCFQRTIKIQPNYTNAYWCLHSFAPDIDEALKILKKLYSIDNKFLKAKIMISALQGFKGNFNDFDALVASSESNHPHIRSIKWIFSLPQLPKIFFNQWDFFDAVVALTDKSRPFYEFGVRNGISFQYLINTFKKGFGFDSFTGLPESWDKVPKGSYSNFGSMPKITGGEFIVGEFKNTLPEFFSKKKPLASLINFDADLYSSTLCALNYSNKVIDEKSILIFDEFLMNDKWEKDEYKALNEFCDDFGISYDVLAVSFFSKQVAVKLKKN